MAPDINLPGTANLNMCIFIMPLLLSSITTYRHFPAIVSMVAVLSYITTAFISGSGEMFRALPVVLFMFIGTPIVFAGVLKVSRKIEKENAAVIDKHKELMRLLAIEPERAELIRESGMDNREAADMVDKMDTGMRNAIVERVKESIRTEENVCKLLTDACPELTDSELAVCIYVLDGMTVSQICAARHISGTNEGYESDRQLRRFGYE